MSVIATQLLLSHGSIQVSPARATLLNQKPPTAFFNETIARIPSKAGYSVILSGYSQFIRQKESATNEYASLLKLLNSLSSIPRPMTGHRLKNSVTTHSASNNDYRVDYRIYSGQVDVFNIQPLDKLQQARDKLEKAALYLVKKTQSGLWHVSGKVNNDKVTTMHAAVNGQSNNLSKAIWLMGSHLEYEFGKGLTEYTLFHNPSVGAMGDTWESIQDKFGFTTKVTKRFASVLEKAQQKAGDTTWVAHSQGGVIFAEGVRYLLNDKSSWATNKLSLNGIRSKEKGSLLNKQKIAFHGNANNNTRSNRLLNRAGVEVIAVRAHDYDLVTNIIGANSLNPRKLTGSVVYGNHVFNGSVGQSPHTTTQSHESWERNMTHGPGQGRGPLQKIFHSTEKAIQFTVDAIKNHLP